MWTSRRKIPFLFIRKGFYPQCRCCEALAAEIRPARVKAYLKVGDNFGCNCLCEYRGEPGERREERGERREERGERGGRRDTIDPINSKLTHHNDDTDGKASCGKEHLPKEIRFDFNVTAYGCAEYEGLGSQTGTTVYS